MSDQTSSQLLFPLDEVGVELTYECNWHCPYCYNPVDISGYSKELQTVEIKSVIDQAAGLKARKIVFIGGEPTLRDDLVELVRYTRKVSDGGISITTNGSLLFERQLRELKGAGLDVMQFSVHLESLNLGKQFNPERLNQLLSHYISTVNTAISLGIRVKVHLVFYRQYLPYVLTILRRLLYESSADLVSLGVLFIAGHARESPSEMIPTREEVESIYDTLLQLRKSFGKRFSLFPKEIYYYAGRQSCYVSPQQSDMDYNGSSVYVAPNGDVMASDGFTDPQMIDAARLGNVKHESLRDIVYRFQGRTIEYNAGPAIQARITALVDEPR